MGTSLSGLTPATTFDGLLKTSDNDALDATLKTIGTGDGTDSVLQLSNSALQIGGATTIVGGGNDATTTALLVQNTDGTTMFRVTDDKLTTARFRFVTEDTSGNASSVFYANGYGAAGKLAWFNSKVSISDSPANNTAKLQVKGSGATSATTSLLVQNSAGTDMLKVQDDSSLLMYRAANGAELLKITESGGNAILYANGNANRSLVLGYQNTLTAFNQTEFKTYNGTGYSEAMVITGNSNTSQFVGIGETTPTARLHVKGSGTDANTIALRVQNSAGTDTLIIGDDGFFKVRGGAGVSNLIRTNTTNNNVGIGLATPDSASRMHIQGKGATSATTALLVQNSAGTTALEVLDNRDVKLTLGTYQFLSSGFISYAKGNVNSDFGVGFTTNPTARLQVKGSGNDAATTALLVQNSDGTTLFSVKDSGYVDINPTNSSDGSFKVRGDGADNLLFVNANDNYVGIGGTQSSSSVRAYIKGKGATSATTALLVENSAGTELFKVSDNGVITTSGTLNAGTFYVPASGSALGSVYARINNTYLRAGSQGINISASNTTPDASAQLQVDSTTQGFLPPRMTTTQRDAISTPAAGLMVYNTTTNKAQCYNGTAWQDLF